MKWSSQLWSNLKAVTNKCEDHFHLYSLSTVHLYDLYHTHHDNRITSYTVEWMKERNDISLWMKGEEKWVPYLNDYVGMPGDTSHIWTVECWRELEYIKTCQLYSWSWLATVSFHHLTLFYISFCWLCYRFAGRLYPPEFSIPALGCGIRFHFLPHALWNFCGFSYPAEYISTECDCISYCI